MKKIITERKWNKLYDENVKGIGTEKENGDMVFEVEEWDEYERKVKEFGDDYYIIGIHHTISKIKDAISKYRLKHIKLGKIKYFGKWEENNFRIEGISKDLYWQMETILSGVIRDYLKAYIKESPIIGNCVFKSTDEMLYGKNDDERYKEWCKLVEETSSEFDELIQFQANEKYSEEKYKEKVKKAFEDLAFIYSDLSW